MLLCRIQGLECIVALTGIQESISGMGARLRHEVVVEVDLVDVYYVLLGRHHLLLF